jgi:hypothetical protein
VATVPWRVTMSLDGFIATYDPPDDPDDPHDYIPGVQRPRGDRHRGPGGRGEEGGDLRREPRPAVYGGRAHRRIFIHLLPTLLGDGTRLAGHAGTALVDLETTSVTQAGQVTNRRFRVPKLPSTRAPIRRCGLTTRTPVHPPDRRPISPPQAE